MSIMFANFHVCGMILYILVRYTSPINSMCFKLLMFNLSRPVEFLFLPYLIASWTVCQT